MSQLLQIKVQENFLEKLKRIASSLNLNTSSFVKMILTKEMYKLENQELSENWFNKNEEEKITTSIKKTDKQIEDWTIKSSNVDDFLNSL